MTPPIGCEKTTGRSGGSQSARRVCAKNRDAAPNRFAVPSVAVPPERDNARVDRVLQKADPLERLRSIA